MSKWKWIAQDKNGEIYKFDVEPLLRDWGFIGKSIMFKLVKTGKTNPDFKETLINFETEDYEINDGVLIRIPRKTELDVLIEDVKKINKKAAKWMNKNRHKLRDVDDLSYCFSWDDCIKYDWYDISNKLDELAEQDIAKETLKYRIGFGEDNGKKYLTFAVNEGCANLIESHQQFRSWLLDWVEVEV